MVLRRRRLLCRSRREREHHGRWLSAVRRGDGPVPGGAAESRWRLLALPPQRRIAPLLLRAAAELLRRIGRRLRKEQLEKDGGGLTKAGTRQSHKPGLAK